MSSPGNSQAWVMLKKASLLASLRNCLVRAEPVIQGKELLCRESEVAGEILQENESSCGWCSCPSCLIVREDRKIQRVPESCRSNREQLCTSCF